MVGHGVGGLEVFGSVDQRDLKVGFWGWSLGSGLGRSSRIGSVEYRSDSQSTGMARDQGGFQNGRPG